MQRFRTVIFAKAPIAGFAKRRLVPALGEQGAARLAERLLNHTLKSVADAGIGTLELCVTPAVDHPAWSKFSVNRELLWSAQSMGDLGERMAFCAERVTKSGEAVIIIGSDCPALTPDVLRAAADSLRGHDACLVPACDGGYVLIGLNHYNAAVFEEIPWGSNQVCGKTRERFDALGWRYKLHPPLPDIDRPEDLRLLPDSLAVGLPAGTLSP